MGSSSATTKTGGSSTGFMRHVKFEHLYAGVSGGVVATLVLHPLDLVKIRFQVNEGNGAAATGRPAYHGIAHAMRSIVKTSGIVGLYQGVTPNVWGAGMSWGLYFFFYNSLKTWMQDGDTRKNLGAASHLAIASTAGFGTLALTNPIWVTKTRLCLQYESEAASRAGSGHGVRQYRGMADALVQTYRREGVRGLYKGFVPGILGISHGAIQFMVYEELKTLYNQYRQTPLDTRLGSGEYIAFAAISKMIAATLTYPYQVIRSRLQDQHRSYDGVVDVCRQTVRNEGWLAFYKGVLPCLLRVTPACAITFLVYENVITMFHNRHKNSSQS